MYRGQDIVSRGELVRTCITALRTGPVDAQFHILPHITLTRDTGFLPPLINLLERGTRSQQILAAMALGSLGCRPCVEPLERALERPRTFQGEGTQSLQRALILALGETAQAAALKPLLALYRREIEGNFKLGRRRLVITALGTLAQNDIPEAANWLLRLCREKNSRLRAQAVSELGVAAWHLGWAVPETWLSVLQEEAADPDREVRFAAWDALENLALLGCSKADRFLDRNSQRVNGRRQSRSRVPA